MGRQHLQLGRTHCLRPDRLAEAPLLPPGNNRPTERIRQGELLLYDRMCADGGWNYGNTKVLGEHLPPYPETTALALIALQEHPDSRAESTEFARAPHYARHTVGPGWGSVGRSSACPSMVTTSRRGGHYSPGTYEQTGFLGETKTLALALLALGDGSRVFRITTHA